MSTLPSVPTRQLRQGLHVSRIIKGGWQLAGDHGPVEATRAISDMIAFYDAGITSFDCADIYAGVEEKLGEFLKQLKQQRGENAAQSVTIHTKYVPDIGRLNSLSKADVRQIIDRSLQRLGVEQLHLVQFHWWNYESGRLMDAADYLQQLQQEGKIRHLGVTNFDARHLSRLCESFDIVSAQVQYSLLDRRPSGEFANIASRYHVHLLTYGALAGGFLTDRWLGASDPGFEFENRSLVKYRLIIEEFGGWTLFQSLLKTLRQIADRYSVGIDTVAIKAMLDNTDVSAVILGARYADRLSSTLQVFSVQLDDQDHAALASVMAKSDGPAGSVFGLERDLLGPHGSIMKYNLNSGDNAKMHDHLSDTGAPSNDSANDH